MKIIATSGFGPAHDTIEIEVDPDNKADRDAAAKLLDKFYYGNTDRVNKGDDAITKLVKDWTQKDEAKRGISADKHLAECAAGIRDAITSSTGSNMRGFRYMRGFRCGLRFALNLIDGTPFEGEEDLKDASDVTGYWWEYTEHGNTLWFRAQAGDEPNRICTLREKENHVFSIVRHVCFDNTLLEMTESDFHEQDVEHAKMIVVARVRWGLSKRGEKWLQIAEAFEAANEG